MGETAGPKRYDIYAQQRIIQKLAELGRSFKAFSLGGIAGMISEERGIEFHREYMTRLKAYKLTDPLIDIIVDWIVRHHDKDFRRKLTPDAIFWEMGESNRDFYFHFSQIDPYDAWEENILKGFEGVYLCAPAQDRNSYLPSTLVRQFLRQVETRQPMTPEQRRNRSLDIKQYIAERSLLILRATPAGYCHAAEFPYSALFPPSFETMDLKMVYEGIGIASGNSIRVFLRECLSRVGKSHSILIAPKGNESAMPHGLSLYTAGEVRADVRSDWESIDPISFYHFKEEFKDALEMEYYLQGTAQIEVSPVPNLHNRVIMTFAREHVYHRKPADFMRRPAIHFARPDVVGAEQIERIINHPLSVGSLK